MSRRTSWTPGASSRRTSRTMRACCSGASRTRTTPGSARPRSSRRATCRCGTRSSATSIRGRGPVWIESYASPVAQPDGAIMWHGIAHDITIQKQTELELREARRVAEAADRAKSDFLANMSHEIRTPMSAILGYAEILANQLDDPDNLQSLDTIRSNGLYLLEIIDDILDLSRIEAGKFELDRRRTRPDRLALDVQALLKLHAAERGLALDVEFLSPLPETVETDPTRVKQVLINLVENAIKFTDRGGVRIGVRLRADEELLQFDITDTGPGIPDGTRDRLFEPFTQADSSVTRR